MMNLITFAFTLNAHNQAGFLKTVAELRPFWQKQGITVSLFRDTGKPESFLLLFLTEMNVDELTGLIKNQPDAGALFEKMKETQGTISVSCLEQLL